MPKLNRTKNRVTKINRRDVFDLLQSISRRASLAPSNAEGQIAFLHEMDAIIEAFIYEDDPIAALAPSKEPVASHA